MQSQQMHVHYAPSSVGALMDPVFLREAVHDAESDVHHDDAPAARSMSARCRAALRAAAALVRSRAAAAPSEGAGRSGG